MAPYCQGFREISHVEQTSGVTEQQCVIICARAEIAASSILLPFSAINDFLLGFKKGKKIQKLEVVFQKRRRPRKKDKDSNRFGVFYLYWLSASHSFEGLQEHHSSNYHPDIYFSNQHRIKIGRGVFFSPFLSRNIFKVMAFSLFNLQTDESNSLMMLLMASQQISASMHISCEHFKSLSKNL